MFVYKYDVLWTTIITGINLADINDDKKWNKFVKTNLEQLGGDSGGAIPDMADIFGVDNPDFANILKSSGGLEKTIKQMKSSRPATQRNNKNNVKNAVKNVLQKATKMSKKKQKNKNIKKVGGGCEDEGDEKSTKQTYLSTTAAL